MKRIITIGLFTFLCFGLALPAMSSNNKCYVTGGAASPESLGKTVKVLEDMLLYFNDRQEAYIEEDWDDDVNLTKVENGTPGTISNNFSHSAYWDLAGIYPDGELRNCEVKNSYESEENGQATVHLTIGVIFEFDGAPFAENIDMGFDFRQNSAGKWVFTGGAIVPSF